MIFIDLSFQILLRTLMSISSPPVLDLLLKSLQKNNMYKQASDIKARGFFNCV